MAPVLIIVASIIVLPFLTYYATSTLFFRTAKSKATGKIPPTIPYFIPGLFHASSFTQSGARKYFAEVLKDYGPFSPFTVRAGHRSYVVLRDPIHISRVLNAPQHLTAVPFEVEAYGKLFGSPYPASHTYTRESPSEAEHNRSAFAGWAPSAPDDTLTVTADAYISILSANMHNKMFQYESWTRIEDLWSFLQLVLLRCILATLIGPSLLKQYPRFVPDYLNFNAAIEGHMYGTPRIMMSGAKKACDRLHRGMNDWARATRGVLWPTTDFIDENGDEDSVLLEWDEALGLEFVHSHSKVCSRHGKVIYTSAMVADVLSTIHTTNTGIISSTFWTLVETLRKPHLTRKMAASVEHHFSPITHKHDIPGLAQEPFIMSLQAEVRRLRTATCAIRTNTLEGFPLDEQWCLPKGATVAMFSHDVALNSDVWKRIQPQALEKPLDEFWAERFMALGQKSKFREKAGAGSADAAPEGLEDLVTKLATPQLFPGSALISTLRLATLAVLFAEFEIQLCDTEEVDAALPPLRESAYGTVKPLEKVAVRIRKRRA